MQSLSDVFSREELLAFDRRVREAVGDDVEYVVEKKIDGLSVSLVYETVCLQGGQPAATVWLEKM